MEYRRLGRTEKKVSILGIGGGYVMLRSLEDGTALYQRAAELGVNYFDGRYGATGTMQRPVIAQNREHFIVGTKTASTTRDDALRRIDEDLEELGAEYIDIFYLRTYNHEMLEAHFAPGGSIEGLLEAKRQGKIHAIGLAGHSDLTALAKGVETGLVDVVQFPLNIVRREAIQVVIPACLRHDAGMVIMKPINVGLSPADVCLRWLANQPVHVMAPGMSTIEHLEADVAAVDRDPMALTPEEEAEVERFRIMADKQTCRICDKICQVVCDKKLNIDWLIYHNVFQNELRRLGTQGFLEYPFADWVKENAEKTFSNTLASLETCNHCGKCVEVCPHELPVIDLIEKIKGQQSELLEQLHSENWSEEYRDAESPFSQSALKSWTGGGNKKK